MKTRNMLTLAACAMLIGSPCTKIVAENAAPSPSPSASPAASPAKPPMKKPDPKPIDPEKAKWLEARKKAMADPELKAAVDAASAATRDANKKVLEKMREIDPSLGPAIDKEEEKYKPRPPKPMKTPADKAAKPKDKPADKPKKDKPADKKAGDGDKPAGDKKAADTKTGDKPEGQ